MWRLIIKYGSLVNNPPYKPSVDLFVYITNNLNGSGNFVGGNCGKVAPNRFAQPGYSQTGNDHFVYNGHAHDGYGYTSAHTNHTNRYVNYGLARTPGKLIRTGLATS